MPPVKINLYTYYKGDSWVGMIVGPILINDLQPTNPLASVRLQFRDPKSKVVGYELNTTPSAGQGTITIDDAAAWKITVPVQILTDLKAGKWDWDLECTDTTGYRLTPYYGILNVKQDITYG